MMAQSIASQNLHDDGKAILGLLVIIAISVVGYYLYKSRRIIIEWGKAFLIILVVAIILGGLQHLHRNKIAEEMFEDMWKHRNLEDTQLVLDKIQQEYNCCGYNGPEDYHPQELPSSCCKYFSCDFNKVFNVGCAEVFKNIYLKKL